MSSNIPISVGLPLLKTSMNPSQTTNKKTGKRSKTGNTRLVCRENIEREGRDPDIDHEKSHLNQFLTDITSTDEYLKEIERTKKEINNNLKEAGKKQLRKDTVDNISLIIKPNYEAINQLNKENQEKFFKDSKKVIEKIWDINVKIAVIHNDELSSHMHMNFMPLVENDLGFKTFNAKQFMSLKNITKLNKNYSKEMQKLGWNVRDMNIYEEMTQEQKQEHKEQKMKYGRSSLEYKADLKKELEQEISQKNEELKNIKENIKKTTKDFEVQEGERIDSQIQTFKNDKILKEQKKLIEENNKKIEEQKKTDIFKQQQETIQKLENENKKLKWYEKIYKKIVKRIADLFINSSFTEEKEMLNKVVSVGGNDEEQLLNDTNEEINNVVEESEVIESEEK